MAMMKNTTPREMAMVAMILMKWWISMLSVLWFLTVLRVEEAMLPRKVRSPVAYLLKCYNNALKEE